MNPSYNPSTPSGFASPKTKISGYNVNQLPTLTPQQMQGLQKLFSTAMPGAQQGAEFLTKLAGGGDEDFWSQLEAPAYSALEKGLGQTANRFSQFGAQDSSAFQNAIAGQSGDLAEKLQSQRLGLQQGATDQLLQLMESLLGARSFENVINPKKKNTNAMDIGNILGTALPALLALL